jgi:hypothetical protein
MMEDNQMSDEQKKVPFGRNMVSLTLRVGTAPTVKEIEGPNGKFETVTFRAANCPYRGSREPIDQWFTVRATGAGAKFAKVLGVGDVITVDGTQEFREWAGNDKVNRFTVEVTAHPGYNSIMRHALGKYAREDGADGGTEGTPVAVGAGTDDEIPF